MKFIELILPLLSVLVGSFLTYIFAIKVKRDELELQRKEQQYSQLLIKLKGFVGATSNTKTKKEFFEEFYKGWLYCSDDVILAINHMINLVKNNKDGNPDIELSKKAIGDIVIAMRKDLKGKTSLDYRNFQYIDVIDRK